MAAFLSLTDRSPRFSAAELLPRFVPPRRFAGVRFTSFTPNPDHPSQAIARADLESFAATASAAASAPRRRRWGRSSGRGGGGDAGGDGARCARYLDGGFGVGKTHLLASLFHAVPGPSAYLSFGELTWVVGFLGMEEAVRAFRGFRLVCIDEFELDDVANTLLTVTFLRSVLGHGVRAATTSNSLPDRLGEGRFNADDFVREIAAIAAWFDVVRLDGPDFRAASRPVAVDPLPPGQLRALGARLVLEGARVAVDHFDALLGHLRRVHPVQLGPLLDGIDAVLIDGLAPIGDQGAALLFVQLVDELYDAEILVAASGCPVDQVFSPDYRSGGYRKKYGRCESRLAALLAESASRSAAA